MCYAISPSNTYHLGRAKRIWYLSPMRAAKVQASLRIRAVSPEPPLLAHTNSESRGTFNQKARSLAPLNGWACAIKICHDGMLEDTNSLDSAHLKCSFRSFLLLQQKKKRLLRWVLENRLISGIRSPTKISSLYSNSQIFLFSSRRHGPFSPLKCVLVIVSLDYVWWNVITNVLSLLIFTILGCMLPGWAALYLLKGAILHED